jgi:ribose transport system substrate-binding protein
VASNPAAIVIAPAPSAALREAIDHAAAKTRIIGIDYDADSTVFSSILRRDNAQAGRVAADTLADEIKRTYADAEGDVAIIGSALGAEAFDERARAFIQQISTRYGALDVVAHKMGDGRETAGFDIMLELIAQYSELRGVFVSDLSMARGAARALAEKGSNAGGEKINFVSLDADGALIQFLKEGTIAALVVQDPFRIGYDAIKAALAVSRREPVAAVVHTGVNVITKANINSTRSQELLNPKAN